MNEKKTHKSTLLFIKKSVNGVYSVITELFEIGVNRKVLFFYGHNSKGSFVGARVVEKSTEKGVDKSRLQGFPVGPMENPIDYRFNGRFSTHHEMSRK
jgi:hypothetical protein